MFVDLSIALPVQLLQWSYVNWDKAECLQLHLQVSHTSCAFIMVCTSIVGQLVNPFLALINLIKLKFPVFWGHIARKTVILSSVYFLIHVCLLLGEQSMDYLFKLKQLVNDGRNID